jgi:uncharacterized repeat protein (TIGR03803 family)
MRGMKLSIGLKTTFTTAICTFAIFTSTLSVTEASAGTLKVLHNFNGTDGNQPAGVIFDGSGNLYGVATTGGPSGLGLAFELSPTASGHWNEKSLIEFNGTNGANPSPMMVFDSAGNLYGTETLDSEGHAAVFKLSPTTGGHWGEKTHTLSNGQALYPETSVTFNASGDIFGTGTGGSYGGGSVFELYFTKPGHWHATTLFTQHSNNFSFATNLVFDAAGDLYGTSIQGGIPAVGTVWELAIQPDGNWTETILYNFTGGSDGGNVASEGVIFDAAGNLYGTTSAGGAFGKGTVFELSPNAGGTWTETVLYSFQGGHDGSSPSISPLTFDKAGNLYGETAAGGNDRCSGSGCGTVFKLSPTGGGSWTESVLYRFNGTDGSTPWQGLVLDAAGNLYGTAQHGGAYGDGVVFELKP